MSCLWHAPSQELQRVMEPLARAATALPPTAFRADPLVAVTAFGRYFPQLLQVWLSALTVPGRADPHTVCITMCRCLTCKWG